MTEIDWNKIGTLSGESLRNATFEALQTLSQNVQDLDPDDPSVLGGVPRLTQLIDENPELLGFRPAVATLARSVGLWNYIDVDDSDDRDRLLTGAATIQLGRELVLHREQVEALNILLAGRNLILSAPTSFGKSLLVDVLLATGRYSRVAIILPTIALLDEFRKRLITRFGKSFQIVMHHSQGAALGEPTIFLCTQERLVNRDDMASLDLLVVDEFYKLDPSRKDDRSMTLNAAVYRLIRSARQFFFLGPNIENVRFDPDSRWKFEFSFGQSSRPSPSTPSIFGEPRIGLLA